jgi:pilus assembly protein CpaE
VGINILLSGSADRELESLLTQAGMRVATLPESGWRELAEPGMRQPDAIVVDLRREGKLPAGLALVKRQHPRTPAVVVTAAMDPALMLEAMRAGVTECVAEPITIDGMERAIHHVIAQQPMDWIGRAYAFIGAKGGVGATTLAVNVASALSDIKDTTKPPSVFQPWRGERALLIDLHLTQGHCAVFLNEEPRFSVVDTLENTHKIDETFIRDVVAHGSDDLDLLASSDKLVASPVDARRIQGLIELAGHYYRHTILDLPRSDGAVLDALAPVTTISVVVSQDLATLRSARTIASALRQRYGSGKVQFVLNRLDDRADITRDDVEDAIGEPLAFAIPSDYRAAVQAVNEGRPVVKGRGALADAFRTYARQLAGIKTTEARATAAVRMPALLAKFAARGFFL